MTANVIFTQTKINKTKKKELGNTKANKRQTKNYMMRIQEFKELVNKKYTNSISVKRLNNINNYFKL